MVNASPADQQTLLEMQELDSEIDRVSHQRQTHPVLARIEELAAARAAAETDVQSTEAALKDARLAVSQAEDEAERLRARRDRDQTRLDSGAISAVRDLEALQHEIETLTTKLSEVEDTELEAMEVAEQAESAAAAAATRRDELAAALATAQTERDTVLAELDERAEHVTQSRASVVATLPEPVATAYEAAHGRRGGVVVAALRQRKCDGCRMEINTADLEELRSEPEDVLVRCPECDRFLVRTAESGL